MFYSNSILTTAFPNGGDMIDQFLDQKRNFCQVFDWNVLQQIPHVIVCQCLRFLTCLQSWTSKAH
jgi:hypothetical protein